MKAPFSAALLESASEAADATSDDYGHQSEIPYAFGVGYGYGYDVSESSYHSDSESE